MPFALDTNVVVRYLHNDRHVVEHIENALLQGHALVIPKMVDYEIRRGFRIKPSPKRESSYYALLEGCVVADIDSDTWEYASAIYALHYHRRHTVSEMDILIAALCQQNAYTLVTNNAKDFADIDRLEIADWTLPR